MLYRLFFVYTSFEDETFTANICIVPYLIAVTRTWDFSFKQVLPPPPPT